MILLTLAESADGEMTRADTLDAINRTWKAHWSEEDLTPPRTRPHEPNWRNRASYERARMIREGLLDDRADGTWSLTAQGYAAATGTLRPEDELREFYRSIGKPRR
ncbi:winged helix-turn-helix domain-containing protein [Microbacterium sp. ZKA21]|uniref:winged helix-turn-helix domain-containing protein n=1 Tax=Microbacterium sp. ZKA21 TaxID=3381694 RepID=UPI003D1E5716